MLTIGVDSHKRSLTAVAVDSMGRQQATTQVPTTCSGRAHLLDWAEALREGAPLRWGIEGSGSYGRPLAQQLARRGQDVLEVPGIATSRERKAALGVHRQKMDTSDALAIARVALREGDRLPRVFPDGVAQRCKVLSEHRDNLVVQRTRLMNQLHAQVSFLDPARMPPISATRGRAVLEQWASMTPSATDPLEQIHLQVVRQLAGLILTYDEMIRQTGCELVRLVTEATPLLVALRGSGALTAARILGEVGDVRRFASAAKFAAYCGAAPIQASSGERVRQTQSSGQSATQLLAPYDRGHTAPVGSAGTAVSRTENSRGEIAQRGAPLPQAAPCECRLPHPERVGPLDRTTGRLT